MTATPSPPPAHPAGRVAEALAGRVSSPLLHARHGLRVAAAGLLLLFPEITVGLLLFNTAKTAQRRRLETDDPERGDAIQWVIVTAIGAAIAVTVGAIIYNKLETKANNIDVTTPGAH
jgi:hypothetical protein